MNDKSDYNNSYRKIVIAATLEIFDVILRYETHFRILYHSFLTAVQRYYLSVKFFNTKNSWNENIKT